MKKIGIICLALVMALGAMGLGYALWSEVLTISGTVQTGDIGAEWSVEAYGDNETKDVSSCVATGNGSDTLTVTITGAYPCVGYYVDWNIEGTGSVPIHFAAPSIDTANMPSGSTFTFTKMDGTAIDWSTVQLHDGDTQLGKLTVHLDNTAAENTNYSFSANLTYGQYNEFP